jgi:hypothetical protein
MARRAKQVGTDLEIEQDPPFQERDWRVQHMGWIVMLVIIILALLGLFGRGPLTETTIGQPSDLQIAYDRVARAGAPTDLDVTIGSRAFANALDTTVTVWVTRKFAMAMQEQAIIPRPHTVTSYTDSITYTFLRSPNADSIHIHFHYSPEGFGVHTGSMGIIGGRTLSFWTLVLP